MKVPRCIVDNLQFTKVGAAFFGLTMAGFITYWLINKLKKTDNDNNKPVKFQPKDNINNWLSAKEKRKGSQGYEQKFIRIINQVQGILDLTGRKITPKVIKMIIHGQYELASKDMKALVTKSRKQRRVSLDRPQQFARITIKYQQKMEQLQEKHLGAILTRFNIDKRTWKKAEIQWQNNVECETTYSGLINDEEQNQLQSYRNIQMKPLDFDTIQQILYYKIEAFENIKTNQFFTLGADTTTRYNTIQTYVNDLVFNKFTTEEEDLQYSIKMLRMNQKQEIMDLRESICEHMEYLATNDFTESEEGLEVKDTGCN